MRWEEGKGSFSKKEKRYSTEGEQFGITSLEANAILRFWRLYGGIGYGKALVKNIKEREAGQKKEKRDYEYKEIEDYEYEEGNLDLSYLRYLAGIEFSAAMVISSYWLLIALGVGFVASIYFTIQIFFSW